MTTRDPALRQAIELALAVARDGERADPPIPAPAGLRRYLSFAKVPAAAREAAGRVIDGDDAFRARVAAAATPAQVGEAGWLWLTRPDGWQQAAASSAAAAAEEATARREAAAETSATRRLAGALEAAARAEGLRRAAESEAHQLRHELAEARRERRELVEQLAAAEQSRDRSRTERAEVVRRLKGVEAQLAERVVEVRRLQDELAVLAASSARDGADVGERAGDDPTTGPDGPVVQAERAAPGGNGPAAGVAALDAAAALAAPGGAAEQRGAQPPTGPGASATPSPGSAPASAGQPDEAEVARRAAEQVDRAALSAAVAAASDAAAALGAALHVAARLLGPPTPADGGAGGAPLGGAANAGEPTASAEAGAGAGAATAHPKAKPVGPPARRRPLRMPPGVFDDTSEAVDFLCRAARVLFYVDGYNVSKNAWPDQPIANQRRRLVDCLANLHARTGARVEVVFDGADDGSLPARLAPGPVRVWFTPSHQEADDLILQLVDAQLAHQPIVVVSTDKRVRDGARQRGANTLSSELFLRALR